MFSKKITTLYITRIAILSAMATIIMYFEFLIPFIPPFLKIDFSEVIVLLAALALGPISAVIIELIKNLFHLFSTQSAGIGELANFLIGISFVVPAAIVYKKMKNKKGALLSLSIGTLSMTVFASIFNYFILLPLYAMVLHYPTEAVVQLGTSVNKNITDIKSLIALGIVPFNLLKGIIVSVLVMVIYKKVSPLLHKTSKEGTIHN